jgi:hypothetical protein
MNMTAKAAAMSADLFMALLLDPWTNTAENLTTIWKRSKKYRSAVAVWCYVSLFHLSRKGAKNAKDGQAVPCFAVFA